MRVSTPRLTLEQPIRWLRDAEHPRLTGALSLDAGKTTFSGGSYLPASTLKFALDGRDPTRFQFTGALHAEAIGPVRLTGRWDGERLRGQAWWPKQSLTVFQPLVPPDWKMNLREGSLYAQVAFSAAAGQGFEAGGHGVLKGGSAWMPDNQINGVDFVLPFRFSDGTGSWAPPPGLPAHWRNRQPGHRAQSDGGPAGHLAVERGQSAAAQRRQRRSVRRQADAAAAAYAAARPGADPSAAYLQQRTDQRRQGETVRHVRRGERRAAAVAGE
jgi:hypothetical protein